MKNIILTGGGTAGHVIPNISLLKILKENNFNIFYIGSHNGIEKNIVLKNNIPYYSIDSGKLRRYMDVKNIYDIYHVFKGILDANKLIKKLKPDVIFSSGGFVSVPVIIAGKKNSIPVVVHESDITIGLANKIGCLFAKKICYSFKNTKFPKFINKGKCVYTSMLVRDELKDFNYNDKNFFKNKKPVIMVIGGSLGSEILNKFIRSILNIILKDYNVIHICGINKIDKSYSFNDYVQLEYTDEINKLYNMSDIIISRAGANTISELLFLKKPNILIPLSKKASRGDQILNAQYCKDEGFSIVIEEEFLIKQNFLNKLNELYNNRYKYIQNMSKVDNINSKELIFNIIKEVSK